MQFCDTFDDVRIYNEISRKKRIKYACTITSRKTFRTLKEFRTELYKVIESPIDCIMEYHKKAYKVHAHGFIYLYETILEEKRINIGTFTITVHVNDDTNFKNWIKYCLKDRWHTLDKDNYEVTGMRKLFCWGKKQKWMGPPSSPTFSEASSIDLSKFD